MVEQVFEGCPRILILGGGFAGLATAKALASAPVRVTLVDRKNHHLFQPLLYQVASATLSGPDIAAPIRHVLRNQPNATVLMADAERVDLESRRVCFTEGPPLDYDYLIVATGARHFYFGKDAWAAHAPGLKSLEEAVQIRRRFLMSFEEAERTEDANDRQAMLTYVIVGGGPTGVEMAGTFKEMARLTLAHEYRRIRADRARVVLVEAGSRILPTFGEGLSEKALKALEDIGVEVRLGQPVTDINERGVQLGDEFIPARTVLWAAGVAASPLGATLGVPLDRQDRVIVNEDLSVPGHPEVFILGDLASFSHGLDRPLPSVAPVAIQMAQRAAANIRADLRRKPRKPFHYWDRGSMATIGRGAAIAQVGPIRFSGLLAWFVWLLLHLMWLVGFRTRVFVFFAWLWSYLTTQRQARLILDLPRKS
ncbi:MAG TPA: NAD(P)/FAD-dependent oxidoreductase [Holophaga sp.]|nr:NAD(P)/FAD-dependent oxidoreductase [Holophaga sp.]